MSEKAKTVLTISRRWNNPMITGHIDGDGISLRIALDDFREAVKAELGLQCRVYLSKAELGAAVDKAFAIAVEGVKEESSKVVL